MSVRPLGTPWGARGAVLHKGVSQRACLSLSLSGTAAIAPIIAAVKDGKSVTFGGREVRLLVLGM